MPSFVWHRGDRRRDVDSLVMLLALVPFHNPVTVGQFDEHANPFHVEGLVDSATVTVNQSIESMKSGAHEDVLSPTRQVKRSEAHVDHAGTCLTTVVIHPNWPTFSPTKLLNIIQFDTTPPPQSPLRSVSCLPSTVSANNIVKASCETIGIDMSDSAVESWLEKARETDLRPELCRRIHEQIALPTLRLLNTAGISFSAAQPEEEAVEDEGEQDDGDADDIQPENEQLEHKDKNAEKQYEEMDEDAGSEQNADAKKTRMTKLSKANISTMKILTLPEEEFEDQLEYEGEKGDSIDHQPDKEPEHHSETNDNDDEIVKKEHFRETGGGEEGSVRETATSARSSSSCASFTTSSKNTPKLTPSDSPLLIDTTSVQFDNLLPVSPAAPKHETVLVDTSVPLFDDSIFFNADFSSRFLSRRRPSSQSFFVDHGYSISDHLVSKRHLLPLPFCGEEGGSRPDNHLFSCVCLLHHKRQPTRKQLRSIFHILVHSNLTEHLQPNGQPCKSLHPSLADPATGGFSSLSSLHSPQPLPTRNVHADLRRPSDGRPSSEKGLHAVQPASFGRERYAYSPTWTHVVPSVVTFHHSNSPNHNRPYEGVYTHTSSLSSILRFFCFSHLHSNPNEEQANNSPPRRHLWTVAHSSILGSFRLELITLLGEPNSPLPTPSSSHPDSPASAPSSPPSTSQVICHPAAPHQTICLLLSLLIRSRRKERRKRQQAFSPSISLHCDRAYHPADPTPHLDPLRSLDTLQQKLQTLFSTHRPASCVDRDCLTIGQSFVTSVALDAEQRTETEAEGDVERGWTGKTLSSPQSQISSFVGEINSDFTSM
ncbi:hypothetical protein BLNAU_7396 [Blattamonas nauphoetae]|uniref:Uncharacterized protein n=1 Tax=Blattamonas nauphoetae TaxID=2049346 RepID=A0ABQ9Y188_9EUKA|nr:hypothetical protein BLNAU_7396 [Blattamonas nauphoetae]